MAEGNLCGHEALCHRTTIFFKAIIPPEFRCSSPHWASSFIQVLQSQCRSSIQPKVNWAAGGQMQPQDAWLCQITDENGDTQRKATYFDSLTLIRSSLNVLLSASLCSASFADSYFRTRTSKRGRAKGSREMKRMTYFILCSCTFCRYDTCDRFYFQEIY